MLSRRDISDADWDRIEPLLPGRAGGHGGVGRDNRLFVNAIRYLAKTGIAWADRPTCLGKPNSLWQRYTPRSASTASGRASPPPCATTRPRG